MTVLEIDTPRGPARAHLHPARKAVGALVLGHGAAGGVSARDLVTVTDVAGTAGFSVVLVEQPYRVAGKRSSPRRRASTGLGRRWSSTCEQAS